MNAAPGGNVMRREENPNPALDGQIMPHPAHIALRQQAVYEALLPIPRSAVTLHGQGPTLTQRAVEGILEGALRYKSVLLAPLVAAVVNLAGAGIHTAPHAPLVGGAIIAGSAAAGGIGAIASLAHITNPPDPHHVATHTAGHAGKIIATAFGMFLGGVSLGVTTWLGLLSGGAAAGFVLTSLGAGTAWAIRIHEAHGHKHIRETDRVRAVAELAAATAQGAQSPFTDGGLTARVDHPIVHQVVWAMAQIGLRGAYADAMPTVLDGRRWTVTVNHPGIGARKVIGRLDDLAAHLQVVNGGLKITRGDNEHQTVWAVNNIPIAEIAPAGAHPITELEPSADLSIWDGVYFGDDDNDQPVHLRLAGRAGIFMAGAPGSGKSNAVAAVTCTVVAAHDTELWTIDGAGRELAMFDPVARFSSRFEMDEAIDLLSLLKDEMIRRSEILADLGCTEFTKELAWEHGIKVIFYVIGEVSHYTANDTEPKGKKKFNSLLADITPRGRANAMVAVLDSQKPEDRLIPSAIRDQVPLKLALKCETPEQVDTILGRGMQKICPAHELPLAEDGTSLGFGYLKGVPGREPFRMRTRKISAEERKAIIAARTRQAFDAPPDGPGGGRRIEDAVPGAPRGGLRLIVSPRYPDGERVPDNYIELWNALDRFADGFTYNDAGSLGVLGGRPGVQRPLDMWRRSGYLTQIGTRPGAIGAVSAVWRKVAAEEFQAMDEETG